MLLMGKLNGKVALVTGAAGGLGKEIAIRLAKEGAKVVINDVNEELVSKTSAEMKKEVEAEHIVGDVSNKQDANRMVDFVVDTYGGIDILVNNAGGGLYTPKALDDITEADWYKVIDVNLTGTFYLCQAAVPYMKKKKSGKIINMSSIGGRTASLVTSVAYAAAKGGVVALTRRLANEVGEHGINVNAVAPGLIISGERMKSVFFEQTSKENQEKTLNDIPLRKLGEIDDIANAILFLSTDESEYITGAVLDVNGGRFMG